MGDTVSHEGPDKVVVGRLSRAQSLTFHATLVSATLALATVAFLRLPGPSATSVRTQPAASAGRGDYCTRKYLVLTGEGSNEFNNQLDSVRAALWLCTHTNRTCVLHGMFTAARPTVTAKHATQRPQQGNDNGSDTAAGGNGDYQRREKVRVPFGRYFDEARPNPLALGGAHS